MSGDLYAPRRGNRGLWVAVAGSAVLHVVTLSLLVLAFQGRAPLPLAPEGEVAEGRHGRSLLEVSDKELRLFVRSPDFAAHGV